MATDRMACAGLIISLTCLSSCDSESTLPRGEDASADSSADAGADSSHIAAADVPESVDTDGDGSTSNRGDVPTSVDAIGDGALGMALGKFCHQVVRNGSAIALTLEFGSPTIAKITATTNTCAPARGESCVSLPTGKVPVRLMEGSTMIASRDVILSDQEQYIFNPAFDGANLAIGVYTLRPGYECSDTDFVTPASDAGMSDALLSTADAEPPG